jgi:GLPGLI family protein
MKYLVLIFLLFNVSLVFSQKIEGKITYLASSKMALKSIEQNNEDSKKHIRKEVNQIYKNAKDIKVILKFNESVSEYYALDKMDFTNKDAINITHIMSGSEKKFYTQNLTMKYESKTLDCYLLGECFLIENELPNWVLRQETKTIQGFLCYKAILINPRNGKQNLEAWYTPKLPYHYGIMEYYGLPGVILELNRNTLAITAIKIELNPIQRIEITEPKNIKILTQEEFKNLTRKAMPDFYNRN